MFIKSNMDIEVKYHKNGHTITLRPFSTTYVDDLVVSPEELKACYGERINIISESMAEIVVQEAAQMEVPPANKEGTGDEELDEFLNTPEETSQNDTKTETKGDESVTVNTSEGETHETEEYKKQVAEAEAYFENIEQDNDSDKHLKLEIKAKLEAEADKDDRCYDSVSLMNKIEELFPTEKARIIEEDKVRDEKAKKAGKGKTKTGKSGSSQKSGNTKKVEKSEKK